MAIVRTTTSPGESTPDPKKSVSARPADRAAPSRPGTRTVAPTRPGNAGQFLSETQTELRRVVWPTRTEVRNGTIVTIGLLVFFAMYIFGLDYIAENLFKLLGLYGASASSVSDVPGLPG